MNVNFEFLGREMFDNVITCVHYRFDKVVFFGYRAELMEQKAVLESFLRKNCGVQTVKFVELPDENMGSIVSVMREEIAFELGAGHEIFFDITGGESLILVAFGMLSKEFETPMHIYDVPADRLVELDTGTSKMLSINVPANDVVLDLRKCIELRGGEINYGLHKNIKGWRDEEFARDVAAIWQISMKYADLWNAFSAFNRASMVPEEDLSVRKSAIYVEHALKNSGNKLKNPEVYNSMLRDFAAAGLICNLEITEERYAYRFKNRNVKEVVWEGGSILELHTFHVMRKDADDCGVGIHLEWSNHREDHVLNEIDVLALSGNVLTFVSCKSGGVGKMDLYELKTVARRFGGKYAKMMLVTVNPLSHADAQRAEEMGIIVRYEK